MGTELYDCPWCGSAKSIEHGICQVCLMEFAVETKVIDLEPRRMHNVRAAHPSQRATGAAEAE